MIHATHNLVNRKILLLFRENLERFARSKIDSTQTKISIRDSNKNPRRNLDIDSKISIYDTPFRASENVYAASDDPRFARRELID
ncbi:MAG: hypothetical protein IJ575_09055 [Selenomonadaceae bacterium]|nr:hypothetical protein [Selenomonadaceae bacterium]